MSGDFSVKVADADQIAVSLAGVALTRGAGASGLADGVYLSVKPVKPSFTTVEGTDGSVVWSKTNSRLVDIEYTTLQTNDVTNGYLSSMLNADENAPNGAGIGSFVVADLNGTTQLKCLKARIMGFADQEFDRGCKERKWKLQGVRSTMVVGGN